jgi:hypothetical protein
MLASMLIAVGALAMAVLAAALVSRPDDRPSQRDDRA